MDIRQLNYFIVTAEERSISHAAKRLHISQPPLTRSIQLLEEYLGVQLFTRTKWGVELTPAGESLLRHAKTLKANVELATEEVRRAGSGQSGRVDIGVFGSAMINIVPRILHEFTTHNSDVNVTLHCISRRQQIEALHRGQIMLGFERYLPDSPGLIIEKVCGEPIVVALNTRHHLASQDFISIDDLRDEPVIGQQDYGLFSPVPLLFQQHGIEPRIVQRATDTICATVMVSGGFGIALVPESVSNLQQPNVLYRRLRPELNAQIYLHCAYREEEESPLLSALLQFVRSYPFQPRED